MGRGEEEGWGRGEGGEVGAGRSGHGGRWGAKNMYLQGEKTNKEGNTGLERNGKMCVCVHQEGTQRLGGQEGRRSTGSIACSSDAQGLSRSPGGGLAAVIKVFIWQAAQGGTEEAPPAPQHPRVPLPSPVFPPQVRAIRGPGAAQAWRGRGGRGICGGG